MDRIGQRITDIKSTLPEGVTLVAVSKFHPARAIMEAYGAGQRVFGESRATELVEKASTLPDDIDWHFIGHLQTNKVRLVVPHVNLIHSVDSERLLRCIDTESRRIGKVTDVLLQLHVALEETKYGFLPDELTALLKEGILEETPGVRVRGIMGMASNVDDESRIASDFQAIKQAFDSIKSLSLPRMEAFDTISMGMSHDYPLAISHGSNMVRIGTTIFGEREY
ncbi:YggS family pyridoxal phosphate-dependent enzyme [Barnesiella sp. WM24]|uniref:YggS family pyridoxal phosphate-dependent enzyme n=1 Tax=Barnesiella sp. WM24 TaxID=2558278 RepID=UPI000A6F16BA|nr:YggS family pyridoxal phosphate-dependent enzyme [Barnesiella sp. WM24]TFU93761.1 YggS family pyridoxal phosphate-dependent enzyme [Barnesiella sp. WM24]